MDNLVRELRFALSDRVAVITILTALALSAFSVVTGLAESQSQRATIERLDSMMAEDRAIAIAGQSDPGGAAYYAYHFTYDPPSDLAFAATGVRDTLPWKHRIKMLAIEGQIYEADTGNPELSSLGRLDFAFVVSMLMPLLLILILHDGVASEKRAGRYDLLLATSASGTRVLVWRAALRTALLVAAIVFPFILGAVVAGASLGGVLQVLFACAIGAVFWLVAALVITQHVPSGSVSAASLLGLWFVVALGVPALGKLAAEKIHTVPEGGEILLTQREAVNNAWDLPKEATMEPFLARYPEWRPYAEVTSPFEWKWYYAFQEVGDRTVEDMSMALREGVARRDRFMAGLSWLSPTLAADRLITAAAHTDVAAYQSYEACVRAFHAELRAFHYPLLFGKESFSQERMKRLPQFEPCGRGQTQQK